MPEESELRPDRVPRNILLICTRDPRGWQSGRKTVLNTIIYSLSGLGHRVTVAHFGPGTEQRNPDSACGTRYFAVPNPSLPERLVNAARWLFLGTPSLNAGLYRGRRPRAFLVRLAREIDCEAVVTDMVRTAGYGADLGLPWIADLDDLLSRRYRNMAKNYDPRANLLGYYQSPFARAMLRPAARLMPWVLRREAAAIESEEFGVATEAEVTTLVSPSEAEALTSTSGRRVGCAPMAVTGPPELPPLTGRPKDLVFLGGLDYGPNLRGLLHFDSQIRPKLLAKGVKTPKLHVIGHPANAAARLSEAVVLEGYAENLDAALQQYRAILVPEVLPGGVKTKIIAAALNGTIVLAHRTALDGMALQDGREILVWETSEDLGRHLRNLQDGEIDTEGMARSARDWAAQRYSPQVLTDIWSSYVAQAFGDPPIGGQ